MQKIDIQLPPGDPIDLWDLTRLIAKSICPSLREAEDYAWLQKKLVKLPTLDLEMQSDMTTGERATLLHILPGLPPRAGMSAQDREVFMDAYLKHPDRLPWKPVFVSEEEVAANGLQILQIQEKHRLALQHAIASGKLIAFDQHHINESRAGKNIFIRREDALDYLKAHRLRTAEDPSILSILSAPRPKASATKAATSAKAFAADHQREPVKADSFEAPKATTAQVDFAAPVTTPISASTPPPRAKRLSSQQNGNAHQSPKKSIETSVEPDRHNTATVILRRRQVEARTSLSRSAIYDRLDPNSPRYDPTFPKQVKLGSSSVGWLESEIENWLTARTRASRL
ncbi:putative DNA-binding transcriptional regulator AlpA [Variovorax sp. OAS795]|uniref:helix-turn-helix transcriptional regulator n=1 Tax=Variovorax sp. OAS795 TaxID=3034231 RepID=UPI00339428C7